MRRLGVTGLTSLVIGEPLTGRAFDGVVGSLGVGDLKRGAAVVPEIELGEVAVKMGLAAVLVGADHLSTFSKGRLGTNSFTARL